MLYTSQRDHSRGTKSHSKFTPVQQPELSHRPNDEWGMMLIKLMYEVCSLQSVLDFITDRRGTPVYASTSGWLIHGRTKIGSMGPTSTKY